MRTRLIIQILSFALIVAAVVVWMKSRATALELRARHAALVLQRNTAPVLVKERDDLRSKLVETVEQRPVEAIAITRVPAQPDAVLQLGEWRDSREWRNEGQANARAAVGTFLWATAGGDVSAVASTLVFDDDGRKTAQTLFDAMSPSARQAFRSPEAMVASLMINAVPDTAAQLSWFNQRDDDHATVGLLVRPSQDTEPAVDPADVGDKPPPRGGRPRINQFTSLSLLRSPTGWQVIVPAKAIERLKINVGAEAR
jgi:hypothetical protein